jgi:hypothetical protein
MLRFCESYSIELLPNSSYRVLRTTEETMSFTTAVEEIQKMSMEEKEALKSLLEKYLIEERRKEMYQHGEESRATVHERLHKFGSDVNELKRMMDEE